MPSNLTHAEEYDALVGSYEDDDGELCRRCNDWPCRCVREQMEAEDA